MNIQELNELPLRELNEYCTLNAMGIAIHNLKGKPRISGLYSMR